MANIALSVPGGVRRASRAFRLLAGVFALGCSFAAAPATAESADDDLPGRVGRVANFAGELFLSPEEQASDWTAVGMNQPITSGDNLWTGSDGRAEIDYGGGQFRLAADTNLHVSRLDDRQLALFVAQGRVIVRVRVLDAGDVAYVDTPNTQLQLTRAGLYRIDVASDRETTTLVVREGEAAVALASGAQQALPGQTVVIAGLGAANADIRNGASLDDFDTWSASRDRYYERGRSTAYVSRQMVGYADLDNNGVWESSPTYGPVWYPSVVVADWAPYRFGHWTWLAGFGYAWVDDAPWGYAPFHYGRWVHAGGRWGWCPGRYVARPIWAPALVGWYGGSGWSVSVSHGAPVYGWVPLAWGEPLHPWWGRCSNNCWTRYNRPYAVNVTVRPHRPPASYVNVRVPGAITAVTGATLAGSRPVGINRVTVPIQAASPPPVLAAAPSIKPLPVAAPSVHPGTRGAPPPASTLYPAAKPRIGPAPAYATPGASQRQAAPAMPAAPRASPRQAAPAVPAAPGASPRQAAPAMPSAPAASPRQASPATPAAPGAPAITTAPAAPPAAAPRIEPRLRQVPRQEGIALPPAAQPSAPGAPPAMAPRVEPKPRAIPRQEGIPLPPAPSPPAGRQVAPAAPPPMSRQVAPAAPPPMSRQVAPAAPPPAAPPPQAAPHNAGRAVGAPAAPPATPRGGEKPGTNPQAVPQEQGGR